MKSFNHMGRSRYHLFEIIWKQNPYVRGAPLTGASLHSDLGQPSCYQTVVIALSTLLHDSYSLCETTAPVCKNLLFKWTSLRFAALRPLLPPGSLCCQYLLKRVSFNCWEQRQLGAQHSEVLLLDPFWFSFCQRGSIPLLQAMLSFLSLPCAFYIETKEKSALVLQRFWVKYGDDNDLFVFSHCRCSMNGGYSYWICL